MITYWEYQKALETIKALFKLQGIEDWPTYKAALAIVVAYERQQNLD